LSKGCTRVAKLAATPQSNDFSPGMKFCGFFCKSYGLLESRVAFRPSSPSNND
jgi:hypothetical protein